MGRRIYGINSLLFCELVIISILLVSNGKSRLLGWLYMQQGSSLIGHWSLSLTMFDICLLRDDMEVWHFLSTPTVEECWLLRSLSGESGPWMAWIYTVSGLFLEVLGAEFDEYGWWARVWGFRWLISRGIVHTLKWSLAHSWFRPSLPSRSLKSL